MSQSEVIEFLSKHKNKWYCAKELKKYGSSTIMMKLRERGFVDFKIGYDYKDGGISKYFYKHKEVKIKCY